MQICNAPFFLMSWPMEADVFFFFGRGSKQPARAGGGVALAQPIPPGQLEARQTPPTRCLLTPSWRWASVSSSVGQKVDLMLPGHVARSGGVVRAVVWSLWSVLGSRGSELIPNAVILQRGPPGPLPLCVSSLLFLVLSNRIACRFGQLGDRL